jgi:hypothetical protein
VSHGAGERSGAAVEQGVRGQLASGVAGVAARALERCARLPWYAFPRRIHTVCCWRHNLLYRGHRDDLFIVTYPKSGTTLMQMLVYQLLSDGGLGLPHIDRFSPFLDDLILPRGGYRTVDDLPPPRVVKTHLRYRLAPKGPGRYIYVMRHGLDVAWSFYWMLQRSRPMGSFERFFELFMQGALSNGTWFEHVRGWMLNRKGLDVLYVTYDELTGDLAGAARRVAAFCGVSIDEAAWPRIVTNCSFETMRRHQAMFDVPWEGDPEDRHFIRRGRVGDWRSAIEPGVAARFHEECARRLGDLPVAAGLLEAPGRERVHCAP